MNPNKPYQVLNFLNKSDLNIDFNYFTNSIILKKGKKAFWVNHDSKDIILEQEIILKNGNILLIKNRIKNNSNEKYKLFASIPLEIKFHIKRSEHFISTRNGWLSVSPTYNSKLNSNFSLKELFDFQVNPYSYKKEYGYMKGAMVSEWFSEIKNLTNGQSIVVGALTSKRFFSQIILKRFKKDYILRFTTQHDEIEIAPNEALETEEIAIIIGYENEAGRTFADLVKDRGNIIKKELPESLRGICCSYYTRHADKIDKKIIQRQIDFLKENKTDIPIDYVQIDDGYCEWGDWTKGNKKFITEDLVKYIKSNGFKAGLWIAPFGVDKKAIEYKILKEALLKNHSNKIIKGIYFKLFGGIVAPSKEALDPTHPKAQNHIKSVFSALINEFKIDLIKIDFLVGPALQVGNFYKSNTTRVDAMREGLNIINEIVQNKALVISAIIPLQLAAGYADYVRISNDVTFPFVYYMPLIRNIVNGKLVKSVFRAAKVRSFLGNSLWVNDYDCMVSDPISGISSDLMHERFNLLKDAKGMVMLGDDMLAIGAERLKKYIKPLFNK